MPIMPPLSTTPGSRRNNRNLVKCFAAVNATSGTGIAEAIKTSFAATAATAILRNTSGFLYRPQYIRLVNTVAPASATRSSCVIVQDFGATRYTSGATALATPKNRDGTSSATSTATTRFGALVTAAATANVRTHVRCQLKNSIVIAFEEILIVFDKDSNASSQSVTGLRQVVDVGPMVIGRNSEMIVHLYHPGNAATPPEWEVEMVWTEARA
jgi:hypothetical protein